jgi:hypothetical protein
MEITLIKPADTDTVEQGFHDHNTNMDTLMANCIIADGTKALSADWDAGAFKITAEQLASDISDGTTPFEVTSKTVVTNLNSDLLDGLHGADYQPAGNYLTTDDALSIYVDKAGSDITGDGSSGNPYLTITKAISVLPDVITQTTYINVGAGEYDDIIEIGAGRVNASLTIQAYDVNDEALYDTGTATSGRNNTLTKTGAGWDTDMFAGGKVWIYDGTGAYQIRDIASNTTNTITVTVNWAVNPNATSKYTIVGPVKLTNLFAVIITGSGNINIQGFQFTNTDPYEKILLDSCFKVGIYYCYFEGGTGKRINLSGCNQIYSILNYFVVVDSAEPAVNIVNSFIYSYGELFIAESSGVGTGIYAKDNSQIQFYPTAKTYMKDCLLGIELVDISLGSNMETGVTFVTCTTDYVYGDAVFNDLEINGTITSKNIYPMTNDTYYVGKNSISTPLAFKGVVLKDTTNGKYYRIEVISGVLTATEIT